MKIMGPIFAAVTLILWSSNASPASISPKAQKSPLISYRLRADGGFDIPSPKESAIINNKKIDQANNSRFNKVKELEGENKDKTVNKIIQQRGLKPDGRLLNINLHNINMVLHQSVRPSFLPNIASDRQIEDFLGNFINRMVENVKMLVDFVISLLKDSLGKR